MADVIRYATALLDRSDESPTAFLLLLDPTSPLRNPATIDQAAERLRLAEDADGALSVSVPAFNPLWVGVELGPDSFVRRHPSTPLVFTRRQDVPGYWRINGSFYLWRNEFARDIHGDWLDCGSFLGIETPEILSHSIDTLDDFRLVEVLVTSGVVNLPWMGENHDR
jgi:N-acylneuraminate cytidylyltransferase